MRARLGFGLVTVASLLAGCSSGGGHGGAGGGGAMGGTAGIGGGTGNGGSGGSLSGTAYGSPGASCATLATTCGSSKSESCCSAIAIPGGKFNRNNDPALPATVADFSLDKYEVTVGRFRAFMNAGKGTRQGPPPAGVGAHPLISATGWDPAWISSLAGDASTLSTLLKCKSPYLGWTDSAGANESLPVNCVNWYEAFAFCAWDGGRLPTEAEWIYAATGGSEQREYPWGSSAPDASLSSFDCVGDGSLGKSVNPDNCALTDILPVGSLTAGNGRWGHADLAGNMGEWTLDWYATSYVLPCDNCANMKTATERVVRGGSFQGNTSAIRSAYSLAIGDPEFHYVDSSFRCARNSL